MSSRTTATTALLLFFLLSMRTTTHYLSAASTSPKQQQQFHRSMTSSELSRVFQVDQADRVPEYEVVHARLLTKRSAEAEVKGVAKEVHITAFGKDFRLRLERNDHLSKVADRLPIYEAHMHSDGNLNITQIQLPMNGSEIGEVYQDAASGAAVLLHHDEEGTLLLDGTLGGGLSIRPAPNRKEFPDDEMFMDNELPPLDAGPAQEERSKGMHIVYKQEQNVDTSHAHSDYMLMEPDELVKRSLGGSGRKRSRRVRREAPEAVWPEILVVVDYDSYNMHGGNNMDIKRYFISFWNGVDLRYKLLGGPKVRISLAGIIISKGRDATPYLENNRVGGSAVDSAGALTELGKYLFRERRLPTYDIAVVVTKLDLCRREMGHGSCNKGTAGFAYVGGACVVNKRLEKVNSVAIIEDTGGFSGIIVAAHEVGHLLGAVHDGSPPPSYLGGPGAEHCRWEDGYIMSDLRHTERGFKWSICSVQQFKHFLNGDTAKCLFNIPHEDDELPRLLPGKLLSLDAQCRKDRGTSACFKDERVCAQLFCFDSRSGYCVSYRPAAEGSPCGDGQYCINGRCIAENENVIPDYSRVSEVVVAKPGGFQPDFHRMQEEAEVDDSNSQAAKEVPVLLPATTPTAPTLGSKSGLRDRANGLKSQETYFRRTAHHLDQPFNEVTKAPPANKEDPTQPHDNGVAEGSSGCRDLMRELAGGLTCKQFLRRFGSRYCNHHYIIAHCCSSRKALCDV